MDRMTEGILERKISSNGSRKIILDNKYFKGPSGVLNNKTLYHIGKQALIGDEAEMGNNFCWETMIGQEIAKLVTMDLIITIASIFIIDFFRDLWIKYCNSWWCWNMETTFPEYGEFKVAENVLHIINNQGMVWLGLFFAPLLPALNNLKLIILMYIRGWACMTCNVPAREIFRASRSSNFYLMVLLLWLLLCTLPVGYVIASKKPSSSCGPFAGYARFYNVLTQMLEDRLDRKVIGWLRYIASPGVVIPVLLLLMLIIYFLVSLVRGLRKTNNDLQQQLIHERTEEKKKIFELAGTAKRKISQKDRQEKKQAITYLPLVEQKRREPWRFYNGQDHDSSLCVTDETSTMTTPNSGQSLSPKNLKTRQPLPQLMIQQEPVKIPKPLQQQITQQNMDDQSASGSETESKRLFPPSSTNMTDWFKHDDGEDSELQSYNVESDVVEEATSEEVRNLMQRLTKSMHGSVVVSSKNGASGIIGPVTVFFPASSVKRSNSQSGLSQYYLSSPFPRNKLADSSLFNKPSQHEPKTSKAIPSLAQSYVSSIHQSQSKDEIHIPTSQLHFPPTAPKDGSVANQVTFKAELRMPQITNTQTKQSKTSRPSNRLRESSTEDMNREFVPWPSAKEVRPELSRFLLGQQKPESDFGNDHPSKCITSHSSCMKTEDFEDPSSASQQHQRRFRISVSPTRRFQTQSGPSESDTDTRYIISSVSFLLWLQFFMSKFDHTEFS
ncbi:hypothetical protein LOAG_03921 [Loa loa]|uniref:TMC domain-containing protein n=1 Tax=Loa loa TaxID=7209 RepID=A0A1S0U3S4_LOALO|nr:hypothetical protein LOAG_03921 [Loa loa]EFO24564.2 hypothetical protein LOAG_03921 [Loa loa]